MKLSELFDEAARLIDTGWTQGLTVLGREGIIARCANMALFEVLEKEKADDILISRAWEAFAEINNPEKDNIVHWNDSPSRTKSQVINRFQSIAAVLEARGR